MTLLFREGLTEAEFCLGLLLGCCFAHLGRGSERGDELNGAKVKEGRGNARETRTTKRAVVEVKGKEIGQSKNGGEMDELDGRGPETEERRNWC